MDGKRFNELTKALASGQSRRGVVRGLAGGLVASALGLVGRDKEVSARAKTGPGHICREHANCVEGIFCLKDPVTRRRKCTCVDQKCFFFCSQACNQVNFVFNFAETCTDECAYECADPNCFAFNQTLPL